MKPVRLTASATLTLPRLGLLLLCALYIFPGLFNHDLWKVGEDAAHFGVMWTMAHGTLADWLWPHLAGWPLPQTGPLSYWIGAIFIQLGGSILGDESAARLSTVCFFIWGAISIWLTTYTLGQRHEAQPLPLAFGGQPQSKDFARMLADGALLIYLGSVGLLPHYHLLEPATLQIALISFSLYITARLFDTLDETPAHLTHAPLFFSLLLGLILGLLALSHVFMMALALLSAYLIVSICINKKVFFYLVCLSLPIAIGIVASWIVAGKMIMPFNSSPYSAWMFWNKQTVALPSYDALHYFIKYGFWFTWPAWPFALWALYAWRRQIRSLHILLPLVALTMSLLLALMNPTHEQDKLMPLVPILSILAAFGLSTMKRGAINAVDWFSLIAFSITALFIWVSWIALFTGWPSQLQHNVFKTAPGFIPSFHWISFSIAFISTLGWLKLVHWRISRHPGVLWRAVVLSSGGVILCWVLLMTLAMPWINYRMTYRPLAQEIAQTLPTSYQCIQTDMNAVERAAFAYYGGLRFAGFDITSCEYFLSVKKTSYTRNSAKPKPLWEGQRVADKSTYFVLTKND